MADRIEPFQVVIPAGTLQAAPQVTTMPFSDGIVDRLTITVPPGPSGLVGFQIWHLGSQIIPYTGSVFIVADNRIIEWDLSNFPQASGWQIAAYNLDQFQHTLYVEFMISETPLPAPPPISIVPIGG